MVLPNTPCVWEGIGQPRRVRVDADMLAIRPALFLAVSALALQGCAGINELAGTTGMGSFMSGGESSGEFMPAGTTRSSAGLQSAPLQQSEQVISMDDGTDAPITYIQASDPIDAPPPPIAAVAPTQRPQPTEASGRPMMLVPAPGQEMIPPPAPTMTQPAITPPMMEPAPAASTAPPPMVRPPQPVSPPTQTAATPGMATPTMTNPVMTPAIPVVRAPGREFIPASLTPRAMPQTIPMGEMPLTPGERNVLDRFTILDRLLAEGLITRGEWESRRAENIGAILAYSQKAPAIGLERDVPDGDAISSRLAALKRSLEMRAITPRQHAVERGMILDALLSGQPRARAMPKAPPADIIEAAAMIGHLERLRAEGTISDSEFNAEKNAIDAYFMTGSFSAAEMPMASTATTQVAQAEPIMMTPSANLGLHLASYRSQKAAQDGWAQISKKHSAQLSGLSSNIRRVELGGGRGTFYRLLAGPVRTRDQAASLCQQLKRSSQYCDPLSLGG